MGKRAYTSTVRAVAARETRAAILRAAEELFVERGYTQATVSAIAERAGVALNTLYASTGGKAALVQALAAEGTEDEEIQTVLSAVQALTDGPEILRLTAESTGYVTRRHETLLQFLVDNATSDPAVDAAAQRAVERYRERLSCIADRLVTLGVVHTDVGQTEQILWFYFGQGAWTTVRGFGWGWEDSTAWLAAQAASALLASTLDRSPT